MNYRVTLVNNAWGLFVASNANQARGLAIADIAREGARLGINIPSFVDIFSVLEIN